MDIRLRPAQAKILEYQSGKMGISAVPGSGKTFTLSLIAAKLITSRDLLEGQEILIVTLVNSAVDNFYQQVSRLVEDQGFLPNIGYRVRTLHGLAHDILRERPSLAGLDERFQIIDQREAAGILEEAALTWYHGHPDALEGYLNPEVDEGKLDFVLRKQLPDLIREAVEAFVRYAKDQRLTPERLQARLDEVPLPLPLADMGCQVFADYQQALAYRGAVDFDDLISLAMQALENDPAYLERLRQRWPFILEDEAQDSSRLQEQILSLLVGETGNWVRVGDPNQAIFETFTTASPRFLRDFLLRPDVKTRHLPGSGRSTQNIIDLANYLVNWTHEEHPASAARDALQGPPFIQPVGADDPNPNPPDNPEGVHLILQKYTPSDEIRAVAGSLERWLPENPGWTVAVLAPRQERGLELVEELKRRRIKFEDSLLASSSTTRASAGVIQDILDYLALPNSATRLSDAYKAWNHDLYETDLKPTIEVSARLLRKIPQVEDYLWPGSGGDWLDQISSDELSSETIESLSEFRDTMQRWQSAVQLPIDQLLLTLAQDLFRDPGELALTHKLALLLRAATELHPDWHIPELAGELRTIARNERRFLGFSSEDIGFDPQNYKDVVVVSTFHKAKGLEWDRVYLMSVNNYDFPSGEIYDQYIAEKYFIRDNLNLGAEALAQLDAALSTGDYDWYEEGMGSGQARRDYVRERLRLLYVGITRAKKELVVTWNTGRYNSMRPALPFVALETFWHGSQEDRTTR